MENELAAAVMQCYKSIYRHQSSVAVMAPTLAVEFSSTNTFLFWAPANTGGVRMSSHLAFCTGFCEMNSAVLRVPLRSV